MKNGFTLVELSIALVIIGLLIGGILVGQSMIESASVNKFIRQMSSYDVAISTFQTKYKSLPGDSLLFSPAGNNDGLIREGPGEWDDNLFKGEIRSAWKHLSDSGVIKETYTNVAADDYVGGDPGVNAPKSVLGEGDVGIYIYTSYASGILTRGKHYYLVCNHNDDHNGFCDGTNWAGAGDNPVFSTKQAYSIDNKIDDGNDLTGKVRATRGGFATNWATTGAAGCVSPSHGGGYNLNSTDPSPCNLAIEIFSSR